MNKNVFKQMLVVAFVSLLTFGCSDDSTVVNDNQSNAEFKLKSGDTSTDFLNLFEELYGSSYKLEKETLITDDKVTYAVTPVSIESVNLEGYIIETPNQDYYFEHNSVNGVLKQYNYDNDLTLIKNIFDLKLDPEYGESGFSPFAKKKEGRRFWGTGTSWGACGPNTDGTPGCFQGQYETYYVCWIATGDATASSPPVTQSCDCP